MRFTADIRGQLLRIAIFLYAWGFNFSIFLITALIQTIFILLVGDANSTSEFSLLIHICELSASVQALLW